jgi:hypothetical protein
METHRLQIMFETISWKGFECKICLLLTCLHTTFGQMPMLPMSTVGPGMLAAPAGAQNSSSQAAERGGPRGLSIFSWKQSSINPGSTLTTTHPGCWLSWILDLCESQSIYLSIYLSCVFSVKTSDHSLVFVSSCSFCWPCQQRLLCSDSL